MDKRAPILMATGLEWVLQLEGRDTAAGCVSVNCDEKVGANTCGGILLE